MPKIAYPYAVLETGEPYQPVRISFSVLNHQKLLDQFNNMQCLFFREKLNSWEWHRQSEAKAIKLMGEAIGKTTVANHLLKPIQLGVFMLTSQNLLQLHVESFERAYLAILWSYQWINPEVAQLDYADFCNHFFQKRLTLPTKFFNDSQLEVQLSEREIALQDFTATLKLEESASLQQLIAYSGAEIHKPRVNPILFPPFIAI